MAAPAPALLSDEEEFEGFKKDNQKTYDSPEEEAKRFNIFQENLKGIREHNEKFARGESTYTQGVNKFADLTHEEFSSRYLGIRRPNREEKK